MLEKLCENNLFLRARPVDVRKSYDFPSTTPDFRGCAAASAGRNWPVSREDGGAAAFGLDETSGKAQLFRKSSSKAAV